MKSDAIVKVSPDNTGDPMWMCGALYETRLHDVESEGRMSIFKTTAPPHLLIAPPHIHSVCDEVLLVLSGVVISMTGPNHEEHVLRAGDFIFLPRNTLEGFKTEEYGAEMLWFIFPGSNSELFFNLVSTPALYRGLPPVDGSYTPPHIEVLREFSHRTGFQEVPGYNEYRGEDPTTSHGPKEEEPCGCEQCRRKGKHGDRK